MSKVKRITQSEAASLFQDGMTIMIGGFMTNGTAERLVDAIVHWSIDPYLLCMVSVALLWSMMSGRLRQISHRAESSRSSTPCNTANLSSK